MANGYLHYPLIKQVPQNGSEVIVDLRLAFPDMRGCKAIKLSYDKLVDDRTDINDRKRPFRRGYRMHADLLFWIREMLTHPTYIDIENRTMDDEWATFLSLDAASTWTEMVSVKGAPTEPIGGNTPQGVSEGLNLQAVSVQKERPYLNSSYAQPLTAEPLLTEPAPSRFRKGQIAYVDAVGGSPGYWVAIGERGTSGVFATERIFEMTP